MIQFADKFVLDFCKWLGDTYPCENVWISILHGFDSVGAGRDEGFAVYNPETKSIFCADPHSLMKSCELSQQDMEKTALSLIAHEYRHHMQQCAMKEDDVFIDANFSEEDAEDFAEEVVGKYHRMNGMM